MRILLPLIITAAFAATTIVKAADTASPSPSPAAAASATPAKKKRTKKEASPTASPAASAAAAASASPSASPKKRKPKASPSPATSPVAPAATPAAAGKSHVAPTPQPSQAPGGGNGMVWVNSETHVYHKEGSRWYGRTKQGKYMSEADAIKEGDHASKSEGTKKTQ